MKNIPNKLFYGISKNDGNNNSHFRYFCIDTVHDLTDYAGDYIVENVSNAEDYYFNDQRIGEPYYIVFGSFKIDFKESSKFVASFEHLYQAISLVEHLTGNPVIEKESPLFRHNNED